MTINRATHIINTILSWVYCNDYDVADHPDSEIFDLKEMLDANNFLKNKNLKNKDKDDKLLYTTVDERLISAYHTITMYDAKDNSILKFNDKYLFIVYA